ncbi:hypothetical protein P3T25_009194 [Paraburkholderia sp. GAS32]
MLMPAGEVLHRCIDAIDALEKQMLDGIDLDVAA